MDVVDSRDKVDTVRKLKIVKDVVNCKVFDFGQVEVERTEKERSGNGRGEGNSKNPKLKYRGD